MHRSFLGHCSARWLSGLSIAQHLRFLRRFSGCRATRLSTRTSSSLLTTLICLLLLSNQNCVFTELVMLEKKNSCAKNLQISINQMSNVIMITIIVVIAIIVTCHRHLNWVITISSWPSASISCLLSLWFPSYHRSGSHNHPMINQIDNQCRHYLTNWSVCHQHSSSSSLCSWSCSCREQICAQSRGSLPFMRSPVLVMSTKYSKILKTLEYQIL